MSDHPPPPGPVVAPPMAPAVPAPAENPLGLYALVVSVLGFCTCGLLSIVSLVMSIVAIRKEPRGLALAALITSCIGILMMLVVLPMLIAIAVPSFLRAREISRRNACQENQSKIDGAKQQWALENSLEETATPKWADLVGEASYLRVSPACPSGGTYVINPVSQLPACSHSASPNFPHVFPGGNPAGSPY